MASAIGDEGHQACVAPASTGCQMGGSASGSWARSVADIIRKLLALTGGSVMPWLIAACLLTFAGMLSLYEARDRAEFRSVGAP